MSYSVIIPTLNEADNIQSCLLKLQTIKNNGEIIVVDGGSTDNTVELAQILSDKVISSDKGRASQMNAGAKIATGKMLIFLHADTSLPDNALDLIKQSNNSWGRFDIKLTGKPFMLKVVAWFMNWRSRLTGIATGDQVIFVNRQLFNQVGGYPDIALMEDISLCTVLKKISKPDCLKAKVTSSGRRWEEFGAIRTILLMWSLRLRYYFGEKPEVLAKLYSRGQFWKP